ncbi:Cog5 [Symbiodinium sp. CCMP2592]|nr:Cog5 [Symbiodinium sp. CCMP2592]
MLLELISEETGCEAGALLQDGRELSMSDPVGGEGVLTLKQAVQDCRPLLCCRIPNWNRCGPSFGEGETHPKLSDVTEPVQALKEWRTWVTSLDRTGTPHQEECWLVYTHREVVSYEAGRDEPLKPFGYFPQAPLWKLPAGTRQWGGARSDVWSTCLELPVRQLLDEHAALTLDRPIPRHQMIVDPNRFVQQTRDGPVWVPCEFDVSADGTPSLVGGMRSHAHPRLAQHVARPVLAAALPLLAKLRRPQLLLDDRRLQVVFKAQRIIVPGNVGDKSDAEYVGLWHVDATTPMIWDKNPCKSQSDKSAAVHNCRVPIGEGTLLVFSNYQMAHRVLRMKNTGKTEASRDFVALFVLDPSAPALLPARSILATPHLLTRTLAPAKIPISGIQKLLEFLGVSLSDVMQKMQRNQLLSEQLKPSGQFANGGDVYTTGNGCFTMIGWLHKLLEPIDESGRFLDEWPERNPKGFERRLKALNLPPEGSNRGLSEVLSLPTAKLRQRLSKGKRQGKGTHKGY